MEEGSPAAGGGGLQGIGEPERIQKAGLHPTSDLELRTLFGCKFSSIPRWF